MWQTGQVVGVAERADPMATDGQSATEPASDVFGQMLNRP
jgi:hypothetical protein